MKLRHPLLSRAGGAALAAAAALWLAAGTAQAQVGTSKHLYTEPDAGARGGRTGVVADPPGPLAGVFALPPDEPRFVYKGAISGDRRDRFTFTGLPVAKYDLMLVFDNVFYEGLTLNRGEDSLTDQDKKLITGIIDKSEPYFNEKTVHRLLGKTGKMEGQARAVCTFLRSLTSTGFNDGAAYTDHRRSLKLVLLEDVGPGWQVARTREIFVIMVKPGTGHIRHEYNPKLGGIRVVDEVKDLGQVSVR